MKFCEISPHFDTGALVVASLQNEAETLEEFRPFDHRVHRDHINQT